MPKAGKKNHILGDFFSKATKKNAKTGKEFGIEGKKEIFLIHSDCNFPFFLGSVNKLIELPARVNRNYLLRGGLRNRPALWTKRLDTGDPW